MAVLTNEEKIKHLLRRFGLGVTPEELALYLPLGVDGAIDRLLLFDPKDRPGEVDPWEVCFEEQTNEIYLDSFRIGGWWALRMTLTDRPLQEKLALFWHDHFAISGNKVEFAPMMIDYLQILRQEGLGNFDNLLMKVSKTPAMIQWLDSLQNAKGQPNENFAREVMELFTIGIGNYTEEDVKETARAFTGWGFRSLIFEQGFENYQSVAKSHVVAGRPMFTYSFSEDLHDSGMKTILGKSAAWTGEEVLTMLAGRKETARYLTTKLWEYFAYPKPEPEIIDRLSDVYMKSGHVISAVLRAIMKSPEFWSDKCIRAQIKSPVDFSVPLTRQLGIGGYLAGLRIAALPKTNRVPLQKPLRDMGNIIFGLLAQQGMMLLFPPDVAGWNWGTAWISSDAMVKKTTLGPLLMGVQGGDKGGTGALLFRMNSLGPMKTAEEMTDRFLGVFNADLPAAKRKVLIEACEAGGGVKSLASVDSAAPTFAKMCGLLFGSPEFQFA